MHTRIRKILVTGGAGFIGSAFVREAVKKGLKVVVLDKLTYAGDLGRLKQVEKKYKFYKTDICDKPKVEAIFKKEKPLAVVHFAAESHVDRSIKDPTAFIDTNIKGTQILLDASRKNKVEKFVHISTDEVYGDIATGKFVERSSFRPSSPYAASKAGADLLVQSYIRTFDFPALIVRPSNNYGPWQFPEKLIPLAISRLLKSQKVPIYAKGLNVREWLFVEDCVRGVFAVLDKGKKGQIYNLGSTQEWRNIEVIKKMLEILGQDKRMIEFVKDRPGHDIRYRMDSTKIFKELGWKPGINFREGLEKTIDWYLDNKKWLLNKE